MGMVMGIMFRNSYGCITIKSILDYGLNLLVEAKNSIQFLCGKVWGVGIGVDINV